MARASILDYIKQNWIVLTRSHRDLAAAAVDPKFRPLSDGRWPVYVALSEDLGRVEQNLRQAMQASEFQKIAIPPLPDEALFNQPLPDQSSSGQSTSNQPAPM